MSIWIHIGKSKFVSNESWKSFVKDSSLPLICSQINKFVKGVFLRGHIPLKEYEKEEIDALV